MEQDNSNPFILFVNTNALCTKLKSAYNNDDNYFIPIGIFLLKWINDSKERFNWDTNFNYSCLINTDDNVKQKLIDISYTLESNNKSLIGIFTQLCFTNINYLDDYYLKDIISFYENVDFTSSNSESDLTGPFMDHLLFALPELFNYFSFITPPSIANLLAQLFTIDKDMNILDITCGTGSILSTLLHFTNLPVNSINLYGQEINTKAALLCKINLLLRGIKFPQINIKDTLADTLKFENSNNGMNLIVSNLPLGLKWNHSQISYNNSFKYGIPSTSYADWLFIQQGIDILNDNGKAAFIVSAGTLFRSSESKIRKLLVSEDLIEAVITLPQNLSKSFTVQLYILIINRNKKSALKNKILFIDASNDFHKIGKLNYLEHEHVKKITNTYQNHIAENNYSAIVNFSDIEKNNFSLISNQYTSINNSICVSSNMKQLQDVCTIVKRGLQITKNGSVELISLEDNIDNNTEQLPYYIKISDLNNNTLEFNDKVKNLSEKQLDAYILKPNDILISARGTLIKTAVYTGKMPLCVFSGNIILIRVKPNKYNPYFLKFYLDSKQGNQFISNMQSGASIISLNPNVLKTLMVPNIDIKIQNRLAEDILSNEKNYKENITKAQKTYNENLSYINQEIDKYIK